MHSRMFRIALVFTSGALLAACGQQPAAQPAPPPPAAPAAPPAITTAPSSSSSSPTSTSRPAKENGACQASELKLGIGRGDTAAGTQYRPVTFQNVGTRSCTMDGYPGVSYVVSADGEPVGAPAERTSGTATAITLQPGATASADVGFTRAENFDQAACQPQPVHGLRVYPPGETNSLFVAIDGTGCAGQQLSAHQLTVKPVQLGD